MSSVGHEAETATCGVCLGSGLVRISTEPSKASAQDGNEAPDSTGNHLSSRKGSYQECEACAGSGRTDDSWRAALCLSGK